MNNLESMKCPDCGAQLNFTEDQDFCFCSHCGTQVFKNDSNNIKIHKTIVNEDKAKILEAENRIKELEYKERAQKRLIRIIFISIAIACTIVGIVIFYIYKAYNELGKETFEQYATWIGLGALLLVELIIVGRVLTKNQKE